VASTGGSYTIDAISANHTVVAAFSHAPDTIAPTVSISLPATWASRTVPVAISANDNVGITVYCVTESNSSADCNWVNSAPTSYLFTSSSGGKTLFAFVKDSAGNISSPASDRVNINDIYKGDVNHDGIVDIRDGILAIKVVSGISPTEIIYKEADVNGDGRIGMGDAIYILQIIAGMRIDPDIPASIMVSANPDVILSDGIDRSLLIAKVLPLDQVDGLIPDGTTVEFEVLSGSASVDPSSSGTLGGDAKTSIRATSTGSVSIKATVRGQNVTEVKSITVIDSFSSLFSMTMSSSVILINNYYQAGSQFSSTIRNNSQRTFDLNKFELKNGSVVVTSTTDKSLLNNGQLSPGQSVGITAALSTSKLDNGMTAIYYLSEPTTGKSFTVNRAY